MTHPTDQYHAHIYFDKRTLSVAQSLHQTFNEMLASGAIPDLVLVGKMHEKGVAPHPKAQFEIHFLASALSSIVPLLKATRLTSLIHPLTDNDLADHTTLAVWMGESLPLDLSVLDPPGHNQGLARFGRIRI